MKKAFVSWSGGKDCCQAAYLAQQQDCSLSYLVNMVTQDGLRSCSHGIEAKWIKFQAEALGIPVLQQATTSENYESVFVDTLSSLKRAGVATGVFGDIDFLPHLDWIEKVCHKAGVEPVLPLWGENQNKIMRNFIDLGFVSVVVAARADILGPEWLGRTIDDIFLKEIAALNKGITPCGEAGEFHSLVVGGPLFKKTLQIGQTQVVRRNDHWYLDIQSMDIV